MFKRYITTKLTKDTTDNTLINLILKGDKKAFSQLYMKYSKLHLLTCLRYVKHRYDAEDLLQESYIRIFKDLKQFDSCKGNFLNWSKRLVINICLQHLRKKRIVIDFDNLKQAVDKVDLNSEILSQLNLEDLTKVISSLPKGYRTVFNMYVIDGFTHKEIAEELKISTSTSKTQLMKAKKMLQKNLSQNDFTLVGSYA